MRRRFSLTPAARSDLLEIKKYLGKRSPPAAARVLRKLREAMRMLAGQPRMGHLRHDLADEGLRFWAVYSFLIIYRVGARPLQVVRVLHASRDVRKLLMES